MLHDLTGLLVGEDEPRPSLPVVVLDNDGGGIFSLLPYRSAVDAETFRRLFATPHGRELGAVADALGAAHVTVPSAAALPDLLVEAAATRGLTLLIVRTDAEAEAARHRAILAAVRARLAEG